MKAYGPTGVSFNLTREKFDKIVRTQETRIIVDYNGMVLTDTLETRLIRNGGFDEKLIKMSLDKIWERMACYYAGTKDSGYVGQILLRSCKAV